MATRFDSTLVNQQNTDAIFRAWVQFIHDTLITTGGWVDPGDTGQMTISTAVHTTTANTKVGYRIYRMADSLQGSFPVYMKLHFGSANSSTTPGMWISFGTGSDGTGNLTGITLATFATTAMLATASVAGTAMNCYGSASTSRFSLGMFVDTTAGHGLQLSVERTKDSTGADTGDGILLSGSSGGAQVPIQAAGTNWTTYLIRAGGTQPTDEYGLNFVLTRNNPSETFGGDIGVGVIIPFKGVAQQPGVGMVVVNSSDVSAEGTFTATLYGSTRTYQQLNSAQAYRPTSATAATAHTSSRICIRYD